MKAWIAFWNGGSASEGKGVLQIGGIAVSLIVGLSRLEAHELWRSWQLAWDQRLWRWSYPRPYGSADDSGEQGETGKHGGSKASRAPWQGKKQKLHPFLGLLYPQRVIRSVFKVGQKAPKKGCNILRQDPTLQFCPDSQFLVRNKYRHAYSL